MNTLTCVNLASMGRHIPTPFRLPVEDEQGQVTLEIKSILRIVPGRRLVALARWRDREVIVKVFFHARHWKRNLLRDVEGIKLLIEAKIPTPKLLSQLSSEDNRGGVLIIDYLQQATSLNALLQSTGNEDEIDELMNRAIETIADCHQAGLLQKDIHLDNFMLASERVYLLDGSEIKAVENRLDDESCRQNLALFFAQFPADFDDKAPALLRTYQLQRDLPQTMELGELIKQARRLRLAKFERKLFRSTSANRSEQSFSRFCVYDRSIHSDELQRFIKNPDSFISQDKLLKQGNTSTVALVEIDGREFVLKRYNIKGFWHGLSRMMRPSRAHHSWRNASILEMLGVATPHPYLLLEERAFWTFRRRAYFLCEYISEVDLGTQWTNPDEGSNVEQGLNKAESSELIELFRQYLKLMNDYHISHGDMKSTNFIISDKRLYVLDLDAMRRHDSNRVFNQKFAADLARFRKNWIASPLEPAVDLMLEEVELLQAG